MDEYKFDPTYHDKNDKTELWHRVNEVWDRNLEFKEILLQIETIKDDWLKIQQSKWTNYAEF